MAANGKARPPGEGGAGRDRKAHGQALGERTTPADLVEARRFLTFLDEEAAGFTFQTFDDDKDRKDPRLARVLHGTLDEHAAELAGLQRRRAGVFVTINETNGRGRTTEDIQRVRALFVDLDGAPLEPVLAAPLAPHLIVESSPGRWHSYWKVDGAPLESFTAVQKALIASYDSDRHVHDLPRVMRLPGFWHQKGEPFQPRILEAEPGLPIPFEEFCTAFEIDPEAPPPRALATDRPSLTAGVAEGSRNATATSLAGKLIGEGKSPAEALVFLRGWNLKNSPPLDDAELVGVVASIAKADERNYPEGHDDRVTIARLAALSNLEYDRVREAEADRLGVRLGTLDATVKAARPAEEKAAAMVFPEVAPWPEPVDGAALFSEIAATVRRFVVCEPEVAIAAALWCAMTWLMDTVDVAPLLHLKSPEKRCGKTVLLTLLRRMVSRPIAASNISPPALFRAIEAWRPTLLVDEADSFLRDNEELRGVINSGHTRETAFVIRCEGEDFTPRNFTTWAAKAIAGIGNLADTIEDRAIILEMRRKLPTEKVKRLRHAEAGLFEDLRAQLARFAEDHREAIRHAGPELPEELHDRAQDNWEALLSIADAAGGDWPKVARAAALALSGKEPETASVGVELLRDIRLVFDGADRLATAELIEKLVGDAEGRWKCFNRGAAISPRQLSAKLRPFGIRSKSVGPTRLKGFEREQFAEAFSRYLPPLSPDPPVLSARPLERNEGNGLLDFRSAQERGARADQKQLNPLVNKDSSGRADKPPPSGAKGGIGSGTEGQSPPDENPPPPEDTDYTPSERELEAEAAQPWEGEL